MSKKKRQPPRSGGFAFPLKVREMRVHAIPPTPIEIMSDPEWQALRPAALEPLPTTARLIYRWLLILPTDEAKTTPEILDWLAEAHSVIISESTLEKNYLPELKRRGIKNRPRVGWYAPANHPDRKK